MTVRIVALVISITLVACNSGSNNNQPSTPSLEQQIRDAATSGRTPLTGDPSSGRDIPDIESPLAQLGMKLFFSRALSGEKDVACASCHHPLLKGGDGLSMPIGTEAVDPDLLGPGRLQQTTGTAYTFNGLDGIPTVPRNAPTTFNIAIWDEALFLDGRVEKLFDLDDNPTGEISTPDSGYDTPDTALPNGLSLAAALSRFPTTSDVEMRGFTFEAGNNNDDVRNHLQNRLQGASGFETELSANSWLDEFRTAFDDPTGTAAELITYENMTIAMSTYQRSQWFVDNPWNAFLLGNDNAINDQAKEGALLFFTSVSNGGAGCSGCHSGDTFTNQRFITIAAPQVGRGKGDGASGLMDFGRFSITGDSNDRFKFRTPSLLNVAETGPWTHSGAYTDLRTMVAHYANIDDAVASYDVNQLSFPQRQSDVIDSTQGALDLILADRTAALTDPSVRALQNNNLTEIQIDQVVAFLHTLTDPCITDTGCLEPWIPSGADTDPDALRLHGKDGFGNPLN